MIYVVFVAFNLKLFEIIVNAFLVYDVGKTAKFAYI